MLKLTIDVIKQVTLIKPNLPQVVGLPSLSYVKITKVEAAYMQTHHTVISKRKIPF
jgi:hypothetical protein